MLGKLMKYDMKYMARVLPWVYLGALALSLIVTGMGAIGMYSESPLFSITAVLSAFPLYFAVIAISICSTVYMMLRIYKNMFSDEGYLTMTLPVKTRDVMLSKLLTGAIWNFISILVTAAVIAIPVSVFLGLAAERFTGFDEELYYMFSIFMESLPKMITAYPINVATTVMVILIGIFSLFSTSALFMLSCSIAQTLNKNRGLASVGLYFGFTFLISSVGTVINQIIVPLFTAVAGEMADETMYGYLFAIALINLIISAVTVIVSYIVSEKMITKKLNMV